MKTQSIFVLASIAVTVMIAGCEKLALQKNYKYETSYFQSNTNKSVLDFMASRRDLFTSMLEAIDYVNEDAAFSDVKQSFQSQGNTFFLLTDAAITGLPSSTGAVISTSYFGVNKVDDDNNPLTPTVAASSWRQFPREQVAYFLRYHIVKGRKDFANLSSTPAWFDTFAISPTNDSAKVRIYMTNDREGSIRINEYVGGPAFVGTRTPNLFATNGVIHVLNTYLTPPTRLAIQNNF
jgi:uncharacterized surface protein with fasciclin (FAS1) repeats